MRSQTYAVRVGLDPTALQARGLGVDTVTSAIAGANNQTPVGTLQTADQRLTIDAKTQRTNADEFRSLVIATKNGAPIHLGDVARVEDSVAISTPAAGMTASVRSSSPSSASRMPIPSMWWTRSGQSFRLSKRSFRHPCIST